MQALADAISQLNAARQAHDQACHELWLCLLGTYPEVGDILDEWAMPEQKAMRWFCDLHFDGGVKSAAELFQEGRGNEVVTRIRQVAHGVY